MHRLLHWSAAFAVLFGAAVLDLVAAETPTVLPEFRVEGTPWLYAKLGDLEILTGASPDRTRRMAAALLRGRRLYPDYFTSGTPLPLRLIIVDSSRRAMRGLNPIVFSEADERRWPREYSEVQTNRYDLLGEDGAVIAVNLARIPDLWMILMTWANRLVQAQQPAFPEWVTAGLFSPVGPYYGIIGIPRTTTVQLPRLSWPDPSVQTGVVPASAADFPSFAQMFDAGRKTGDVSEAERWKFEFQSALFARWSLFGRAKNGRNRGGYWAFAEMARRGQATEAIFRECYGMDWTQACALMRAYLRPKNVGMLEVRMPQVMADVPEAERLEFRDATLEEARRILGEFNRLRIERIARQTERVPPPHTNLEPFPGNSVGRTKNKQ